MSGRSPSSNCQLRLKRSGEPSRLSLRRQWIFRLALPDDIGMKGTIPSAHLLYWINEAKITYQTPVAASAFVTYTNKVRWLMECYEEQHSIRLILIIRIFCEYFINFIPDFWKGLHV